MPASVLGYAGTVTAPDWADANNAKLVDSAIARDTIAGSSPGHTLTLTNFGFGAQLLGEETIVGYTVEILKARGNETSGISDLSVRLVVAGVPAGDNKADATAWSSEFTWFTYGGSADQWGTALTVAQVVAADFGVVLQPQATAEVGSLADVDCVRLRVWYTPVLAVGSSGISSMAVGIGLGL